MQKVRAGEAAPLTGSYKCVACGYKVELKKGDKIPVCPICGQRDYELWSVDED
jgi:rubrerythrin